MPELLEVSMTASVAGEIRDDALTARRPFCSPHHSASMAALTGGGMRARPGENSLAHQGALFLDELPEFDPHVLDSLRRPRKAVSRGVQRQPSGHLSRAFHAARCDESPPRQPIHQTLFP
jgi:magnesium chelatase family protein